MHKLTSNLRDEFVKKSAKEHVQVISHFVENKVDIRVLQTPYRNMNR